MGTEHASPAGPPARIAAKKPQSASAVERASSFIIFNASTNALRLSGLIKLLKNARNVIPNAKTVMEIKTPAQAVTLLNFFTGRVALTAVLMIQPSIQKIIVARNQAAHSPASVVHL